MALVVDKCCGCIDLKTGCFILGYLNLIINIIMIVLATLGMIAGGVVAAQDEPEYKQAGVILMIVLGITLLFLVLFLAFTIVLLVGLHKNKPGHLKAYLIYAVIFLVFTIISFFASFAGTVNAGDIVRQIFSILLNIYFLVVIRSQYLVMKDPSKRGAIYNTA